MERPANTRRLGTREHSVPEGVEQPNVTGVLPITTADPAIRCQNCGTVWDPRTKCPSCGSADRQRP